MDRGIRILSTKKLQDPVVAILQQLDDVIYTESDFIGITPVACEPGSLPAIHAQFPSTAIAFTSGNAVKFTTACYPYPEDLPHDIFCLEGNTQKQVSEAFGTDRIAGTAPDAASLARKIIDCGTYDSIIFFCGNLRRDELPEILRKNGIEVGEVVVYTTVSTPLRIEDIPDAVLFFSPSTVESFFSLNQLPANAACFAIGETTAAAIRENSADNTVIIAAHPDQEAMLQALLNYFQLTSIEPTNQ